ncbi:hypothetical protein EON65_54170, partial [archaeon]
MLRTPTLSHRQKGWYKEYSDLHSCSLSLSMLSSSSRTPLKDMMPLTDIFTFNFTIKTVLMAGLLATNATIIEFNQFELQQLEKPEDEREDFDWHPHLPDIYMGFQYHLSRLFTTSLIRKAYEAYAYYNLSIKMTDKLTKNVYSSLLRKRNRYHNNMRIVCQKIFKTSLYSSALLYLSLYNFDLLEFHYKFFRKLYEEYYGTPKP